MYELKHNILDGKPAVQLKCPKCGVWGYIDDDQYHGRVSTLCSCGYHETVDLEREERKCECGAIGAYWRNNNYVCAGCGKIREHRDNEIRTV
jgi:hypothetical protein